MSRSPFLSFAFWIVTVATVVTACFTAAVGEATGLSHPLSLLLAAVVGACGMVTAFSVGKA